MREPDPILVTGATGYVGSKLVDELRARGHARPHAQPPRRRAAATRARATCSPAPGLPEALEGVEHRLLPRPLDGLGRRLRGQGPPGRGQLRRGGAHAGVERVIYLGGLGSEDSEHLRSRHEVAELLRARLGDRLVYVRAAMIIGPGSASYDILEHLVKRLPVMIVPRWLDTQDAADRARATSCGALADAGRARATRRTSSSSAAPRS